MQTNTTHPPLNVLRVDASARLEGSVTRRLADQLIQGLMAQGPQLPQLPKIHITRRELATGLPLLNAGWVAANFTDEATRSEEQRQALALSDTLVEEVKAADLLVIATPIYNFSVPAVLKAWFDQVARARLTFRYTEHGPQGLLTGKKAYVLVATGGTQVGGEMDFATPWLRFMLGFLGITDVTIIAADQGNARGEAAQLDAAAQITALLEAHGAHWQGRFEDTENTVATMAA